MNTEFDPEVAGIIRRFRLEPDFLVCESPEHSRTSGWS